MNITLKCSRVVGSSLALIVLGGIWIHYARLVADYGGIAHYFHRLPSDAAEQLFAVLLPDSALLLLIALPFSRIVSLYRWRIAFGLLVGLSLYWFLFVLASHSVGDGPFFVFVTVFLFSQAGSVWLQRYPSISIAPATA